MAWKAKGQFRVKGSDQSKPKKSEYRKYKLRTIDGNDDFEAMKEVITRSMGLGGR